MSVVTRYRSHEVDTRVYRSTELSSGLGQAKIDGTNAVYQDSVTKDVSPNIGWRAKVARGINASTPMTAQSSRSVDVFGDYAAGIAVYSQGKVAFYQHYRIFGALWACPMPTAEASLGGFNRANNMALMETYSRISKAQQGFQGLVAGGELGEALRMIRNPAKSLRQFITKHRGDVMKRLRKSRVTQKEARRVIAESWLEAVFGWRPLLSDIDSGVETLAKVMTYVPDRVPIRAFGKDRYQAQVGTATTLEWGPLKLKRGPYVDEYINNVRYYGSVGMEPLDISGMASRFGVSWSDVVPAAWELIPYSFLVDYFTNVGDIISACAINRSGVRWLARGEEKIASRLRSYLLPETFIYTNEVKNVYSTFRPGSQRPSIVRSVARIGSTNLGIPSLQFTVPGMSTKWINIAALLFSKREDRSYFSRRG